jgi:hypothetical protein
MDERRGFVAPNGIAAESVRLKQGEMIVFSCCFISRRRAV